MKKQKKIKIYNPDSLQWEKMANSLARSYCPPIHICRDCNAPVIQGYCCDYCSSTNP